MKNFSTKKRLLAPVAQALALTTILFSTACEQTEQPSRVPAVPVPENCRDVSDLSPEGIARILSELPITSGQVREVYDAVTASSSNGYDEEYPSPTSFPVPAQESGTNCSRPDPPLNIPPLWPVFSPRHLLRRGRALFRMPFQPPDYRSTGHIRRTGTACQCL